MNVQLAHMFYVATQQATLLPKQRKMTPELVCRKTGVEMGKIRRYLEEIKDEIAIFYPEDILAIIVERKAAAKVAAIARSNPSDISAKPGSVTLELVLLPAPFPYDKAEASSSALGK